MGKKPDQKVLKVNNIYTHSVKVKKSPKNTPIKRTRGASRKGEIRGEPAKEDKRSEDEVNVGTPPQTSTETAALEESENSLQRTATLPAIPSRRPASEKGDDQARGAKERRVSFPMINAKSYNIFNDLKLDNNIEAGIENTGSDNATKAKNSKTPDVTENNIEDSDIKEPLQKPEKTNVSEELDAKQVIQPSSQAVADQKILENLLKQLEDKNTENEEPNNENTGVKKTSKLALFRRAAQATKQAKKVSNALIADLNLRYLHAVYNDTDYNEKYERLNTPDIETDEEKDEELLQEIQEEVSSSETMSESEVAMAVSSSETESNESEHIDSESDTGSPDKIPEEIKEIIENTQADDGDDLRKLGIWNEEEEAENENDVAKSVDEADEADNEESGDDWSIATFEDEDDSENENAKKKKKVPTVVNTDANATQKPLMSIPLPHKFPLPVGDTPDIVLWSGDESTCTIYASHIDEYESDIFGPRLQHDMFYKPPSLKSDAGDSDMFYCVPSLNISFYSTRDYFPGKEKAKAKKIEKKAKKMRHRKELNEQFLKSAMKKYAVQDKAIAQYGNATKAFRLRMAKLGKDPKDTDAKANSRIEKQLRKRISRKPKKTEELTKNNVKKLPNLSKKARIMRWVKLYDKNGLLKTFYENGWVDQQEELAQSTTGRIVVAKSQDPSSDVKNLADITENRPVDTAIEQNEKGKGDGQDEDTLIDEKAEYSKTNNSDLKRRKKRKKRKILDNMKIRKEDMLDKSSEESFLISKDWQISVRESKSIDENEEDEEIPKSNHSNSNAEQESNSDDGVSICASSHKSEVNLEKRIKTPDSEPEAIAKRHIRYEKRNKKQNIVSHWGVVPGLILSKKRNTLNSELADVTRLLFEQLSLKTKNYSKLPPIQRSGAFSMATSRTARMGQRTSSTGESRNSQLLAIGTP